MHILMPDEVWRSTLCITLYHLGSPLHHLGKVRQKFWGHTYIHTKSWGQKKLKLPLFSNIFAGIMDKFQLRTRWICTKQRQLHLHGKHQAYFHKTHHHLTVYIYIYLYPRLVPLDEIQGLYPIFYPGPMCSPCAQILSQQMSVTEITAGPWISSRCNNISFCFYLTSNFGF